MGLVFIDTETGGLDPISDELIEIAWATLENPEPKVIVVKHVPAFVGEFAAKLNGYYERGLDKEENWASTEEEEAFLADLEGATMVGANISFDMQFIANYYGWTPDDCPWHYRSIDIESVAYHAFGYPKKVPGMKDIRETLQEKGFKIPNPDHTAAADVRTLIASFQALKDFP